MTKVNGVSTEAEKMTDVNIEIPKLCIMYPFNIVFLASLFVIDFDKKGLLFCNQILKSFNQIFAAGCR